jgi:uncharacterized protein involved in type VI secretion and phage assembly
MAICGKHRGIVVENRDPQAIGRLKVKVPDVLGDAEAFAMPSLPYAGPNVGFLALPPIGANVWVDFEECDTARPVWSGCFWGPGEAPAAASNPAVKVFQTDTVKMTLSEVPGEGFAIEVGSARLLIKPNEIEIKNGAAVIRITPAQISINDGALEVQ